MLSMFVHILFFSEYDLIRNNNNVIQHNLVYKGFSDKIDNSIDAFLVDELYCYWK